MRPDSWIFKEYHSLPLVSSSQKNDNCTRCQRFLQLRCSGCLSMSQRLLHIFSRIEPGFPYQRNSSLTTILPLVQSPFAVHSPATLRDTSLGCLRHPKCVS